MDKAAKLSLLDNLNQSYNTHSYIFYVNYKGTSVSNLTSLRRSLDSGAYVKIVKNTLNKIAARENGFSHVQDVLKGQIITIFSNNPVDVAKTICKFAAGNSNISVVGLGDKNNFYNFDYITAISKLPSMNDLRSQLIGLIKSPHRNIAYLTKEVPQKIARLVSMKPSE